jgi:hypothetical protein
MPAARKDIVIEQGATFGLQLTLRLNATTPLTLTNYLIRAQLREDYSETSTPINFTITQRNDAQGSFILSLTATTTGGMKPVKYVYDVEIESPGGEVTRVMKGTAAVDPEVTR